MAKPEDVITIVRGSLHDPHNINVSYVPKLDEILITDDRGGTTYRFYHNQLTQVYERVNQVRSKYKKT